MNKANHIENTILAINISHDTSIAIIKNGEVVDVFEEERSRRSKYYAPDGSQDTYLQVIQSKINPDDIDEVVFTSFDRRMYDLNIAEELPQDRLRSRQFIASVQEEQLSRERLDTLVDEYTELTTVKHYGDQDKAIADDIVTNQLNLPKGEYLYNIAHHEHHAYCGFGMSDMDDAVIIAMDGGGCRKRWETHPTHQEIESIYYGNKEQHDIECLFQKLSNHRFCGDLSNNFPNELYGCMMATNDSYETEDGIDYCFTSMPSAGMNFSNVSSALGTDKLGRAAGKVMGMASYGSHQPLVNNKYNIAHELELSSFEYTCDLIQRAIDYKPDCKNIILTGGFALNCTNNYKYLSRFPDYQIFVDPIPHDGGTAAGAGLQMYQFMLEGEVDPDEPYCKPSVWVDTTPTEWIRSIDPS